MADKEKKDPKLLDEVSSKYDLVGTKPGKFLFADFGELDLTAITAKDAKILVDAGFPYLKPKGKAIQETDNAESPKPGKG
jgi:hypothetical protein